MPITYPTEVYRPLWHSQLRSIKASYAGYMNAPLNPFVQRICVSLNIGEQETILSTPMDYASQVNSVCVPTNSDALCISCAAWMISRIGQYYATPFASAL